MLNHKILIVDPEFSLRETLTDSLLKANYKDVFSVENPEKALQLIQQSPVDLIITEVRFVESDGFELIKAVKKDEKYKMSPNKPVAVIVLTSYADLKNGIESKKAGADDFVSKPYDLKDLLYTIKMVLSE